MIHYEHRGVVVRDAVEEDIAALGGRLRDADEKEIIAAGNENGEQALRQSFTRSSLCYCVDIDGVQVGMCGLLRGSILGGDANVWFLGASELGRIKKTFVRLSRLFIAEFLSKYPVLWNVVDSRYTASISWLESCGAVFHNEPILMNGVEFLGFVIRRKEA